MSYLEDLKLSLVAKDQFRIVPGRQPQADLRLLLDGSVECPYASTWELLYSESKGAPEIRLFDKSGKMSYWFWLGRRGEWAGFGFDRAIATLAQPLGTTPFDWSKFKSRKNYSASADTLTPEELEKYLGQNTGGEMPVQQDVERVGMDSKTAIAMVCCDRPDRFEKFLDSLVIAGGNKYPLYLFADMPRHDAKLPSQKLQVKMAKDRFDNVSVIERTQNWGAGRNLIDAHRQVFDVLNYDKAFFFEDDLILSRGYLSYCEGLMKWATARQDNIWATQGWSRESNDRTFNTRIRATYDELWGYLMTRESWDKVSSTMYSYETTFLPVDDYTKRNRTNIESWLRTLIRKNVDKLPQGEIVPQRSTRELWRINLYSGLSDDTGIRTGQDGVIITLMDLLGLIRLCPEKTRAIHPDVESKLPPADVVSADENRRRFTLKEEAVEV